MADLKDFKLDEPTGGLTGDLTFGSATGLDFQFVTREELVKQSLQIALSTFKGEWFLDTQAGVPYFQDIMDGNKKTGTTEMDALIKDVILDVAEVNRILVYESSFATTSRRLAVQFKVDTTYGPVEIEGVTI
jgi:hypothetical protein